jgi:hypothetical protein
MSILGNKNFGDGRCHAFGHFGGRICYISSMHHQSYRMSLLNKELTCINMHLAVYANLQHINSSSCSIFILKFLVEHNEIQEQ